ncbi:MAG: polysaccharide biosynthesis tyrosine autokinase [Bacteroidota bacterium]
MKKEAKDGELDLQLLFFKLRAKWYYFAISLFVMIVLTFISVKLSSPRYGFKAKMLIEDESGSKRAQDALKLLDQRFNSKGMTMADEIGLLTSSTIVERTVASLDFAVSYFFVEKNWLNTFGDFSIREQYENVPFRIVLDPTVNQLIGTPIYIKVISDTQYQLHVKAKKAKTFNLVKNIPIKQYDEVEINQTLDLDKPYKDEYMSFKIIVNDTHLPLNGKASEGKYFFVINDLNYLTKAYQAKLAAKPLERDSRLMELTSEGEIAEKEIRFLNKLMEVFIEYDLEEKNKTGELTLNFIDKQITGVSDSLRQAQEALTVYQSSQHLIDPKTQSNSVYLKLDGLTGERDRAALSLKYYENVLNLLHSDSDISSIALPSSVGIDNSVINSLILQLNDLYRQKAAFNVYSKKDNPLLQGLEGKIVNAKQSLEETLSTLISSTNISMVDINRRIAQTEGNIYRLPKETMTLLNLEGKTNMNDKTYDFLLEKRTEAAIALATNTPDKKIIDYAELIDASPIFPKTKPLLLIAILIGLFVPASILLIIDRMDNTIKTKEDLAQVTNIPFLGFITDAGKNAKLALIEKPKSVIAESFRSVRVNLQYLAVGTNKKVIGITSSISGEGKTFCSANISCELALSGKKTILIETDLRKPTVSRYFGLTNKIGLSSYLIKNNHLDEVIQKTKVKNLDVITSGPIPPNPIELMAMPEMEALIKTLKENYDYVILDIPPIGFVSEYFILLSQIDATLYIARHKYTSKDMLEQINELYNEHKINHLYLVINGMEYNSSYEYGYKVGTGEYYK